MRRVPACKIPLCLAALLAIGLAACDDDDDATGTPTPDQGMMVDSETPPATDPGALVAVTAQSTVGVLLDELPAALRERVATELLSRPEGFWVQRAHLQMRLANYRLVYRVAFYDEAKGSLPLPPEALWNFTMSPAERRMVDGHDLVVADFTFNSTLLTTPDGPEESEPALAEVDGTWSEPMVFPIDPTLLVQRTGYACMDEDGFPRFSVDGESAHIFYDHECEVEAPGEESCHLSLVYPDESCLEALDAHVGKVELTIDYTRLAWDAAAADAARHGEVVSMDGPNLRVSTEHLANHRVVYEYIAANSCAYAEGCVPEPGWRRLLRFDSATLNVGAEAVAIGEVDYLIEGDPQAVDNHRHGVYEFSECHGHYHFQHYGEFSYANMPGTKAGFCLESTDRGHNNELTPLSAHYECGYQGVDAGWYDVYHGGLPCNWVDVTDIDTAGGAMTADLRFDSNPDGFVCEGAFETDESGAVMWESTDFTAADGAPVDRPICDFVPDYDSNNHGTVPVELPMPGESMVTRPCARAEFGPLRDCGFAWQPEMPINCNPGETVTLTCAVEDAGRPQAIRFCPLSEALGVPIPCVAADAKGMAVVDGDAVAVEATCPEARGDGEPGGALRMLVAPAFAPDGMQAVTCQLAGN
ncbi:MAG: hypothetical protein KC620_20355 [Myxococcales bacterium]|nr:hypothetical protein [Myxococcales bacterium]